MDFAFISRSILSGKGQPSSLEKLSQALVDNLFYNNENMARYALAELDETRHTREYAPNLWNRNEKGLYVWTVEHIFPQGSNIPPEWVDMIANGDRQEAIRIQNEWVHCLGNLTLSGYNSKLSNMGFEKKQTRSVVSVFGSPINIGYQNGLALNNIPFSVQESNTTLATTDCWSAEHIEARNKVMVDMLSQLFKFENE